MNKLKKLAIIFLIFFIPLIFFSVNTSCQTTIGDTTFPIEVGEKYTWVATSGPPGTVGSKITFEPSTIYQGVHNTIESLIVNCNLELYNKSTDTWQTEMTDGFYLATNQTQDYMAIGNYLYDSPMLFAIPINLSAAGTPSAIDLPLAGNALIGHTGIISYSRQGNRLILTALNEVSYEQTFNNYGILTRFETLIGDTSYGVLELLITGGGDENEISFGFYFLIVAILGVLTLVIVKKRVIKQ